MILKTLRQCGFGHFLSLVGLKNFRSLKIQEVKSSRHCSKVPKVKKLDKLTISDVEQVETSTFQ